MRITMTDIRHRLSKVGTQYSKPATINGQRLYEQAIRGHQTNVVRRVLSSWESLAESDISSLSKLLDVFDVVAESKNVGLLKTMTTEICENVIPKVRNGMETNALVKHRVSRFKTKVQTKIQNKINDIENLIDGNKISDAQAAISAANAQKTVAQANGERDNGIEQSPQEECYNRLMEAANKVVSCDRVIENYNSISKRFNIDRTIRENCSLGVYDIVFEVCKLIDTYEMPLRVKYNTSLESCIYGLEKNGVKYEAKEVVRSCTEYFLLKEDAKLFEDISGILEDAQLFDPEVDYDEVEYITEKPEDDEPTEFELYVKELEEGYDMVHEKEMKNFAKSVAKSNKNEVKDLINSIKTLPEKTPEKIKAIIRKIYTKSPEQVIDGTPNLLAWIRVGLVCSTLTSMGPLSAIIIFIVDQFIAMGVKRAEAERMVKKFTADIEATRAKIEKTKDEDEKKRLEEYVKTLVKQTDRLVEYRDSLHTDEENMNREPDTYDTDNNDDFDLGDLEDFDFDIDESYTFNGMLKDVENISGMMESFTENLKANLGRLDYETSDILAECLASIPDIVDRRSIIETYDNLITEERAKSGLEKYQRIDAYKIAKHTLESAQPIVYDAEDPYTSIKVFQAMKEVYEAIDMLGQCQPTVLNELSFTNTLKMAREKLKKGLTKLSDTERAASKSIDMSAEKIEKNVERSLSSDNREMIIKGSLLPSASKCLKTALAAGATAVLINPVIAIIGVLGKMAVSKKFKAKERQLILDEIEVELQMVDKYLKIAEDKNDMQATKHLLTTKRTLERERQRIKYKMNVNFKQHVPNTKETDYDNY